MIVMMIAMAAKNRAKLPYLNASHVHAALKKKLACKSKRVNIKVNIWGHWGKSKLIIVNMPCMYMYLVDIHVYKSDVSGGYNNYKSKHESKHAVYVYRYYVLCLVSYERLLMLCG